MKPVIQFFHRSRREVAAGAVLIVVAVMLLGRWHHHAEQRAEALAAELARSEGEWAVVAASLEAARRVRGDLDKFAAQAAEVRAACDEINWASAVAHAIRDAEAACIDLREIRAQTVSDGADVLSLRFTGFATGSQPRAAADTFRRSAQSALERKFGTTVSAQIEKMEDLPGTAARPADERPVSFAIVARIEMRGRTEGRKG